MCEMISNTKYLTNEDLDGMSVNEQISLLTIENNERGLIGSLDSLNVYSHGLMLGNENTS